jgi:uncharacterized membrane protein (UPF0127 family)
MQDIFFFFLVAFLLVFAFYFISARGRRTSITITTEAKKKVSIEVELADNGILMAKGLMGRAKLGENEGMLFVFGKSGKYGFWMFNTNLELEAIHFSEDGTVVDVISMKPNTTEKYYPSSDSKYVLEVLKGFSEKNGIKIGKSMLSDTCL